MQRCGNWTERKKKRTMNTNRNGIASGTFIVDAMNNRRRSSDYNHRYEEEMKSSQRHYSTTTTTTTILSLQSLQIRISSISISSSSSMIFSLYHFIYLLIKPPRVQVSSVRLVDDDATPINTSPKQICGVPHQQESATFSLLLAVLHVRLVFPRRTWLLFYQTKILNLILRNFKYSN